MKFESVIEGENEMNKLTQSKIDQDIKQFQAERDQLLHKLNQIDHQYETGQISKEQHDKLSKKSVNKAMRHPDVLGAGATKRKHLNPEDKFHAVMKEFKHGTLHSGSGEIVTDKNQALSIAFSEKRKIEDDHGLSVPKTMSEYTRTRKLQKRMRQLSH